MPLKKKSVKSPMGRSPRTDKKMRNASKERSGRSRELGPKKKVVSRNSAKGGINEQQQPNVERRSAGMFQSFFGTIGIQLTIAGSAIAILLLLGIVERSTFSLITGQAASTPPVTIGVEHDRRVALKILFARKNRIGYSSFFNESDQVIHLSLPSSWQRTEVTGASLEAVSHDIPVFGFVRWTLPPRAGMKLTMPEAPGTIFFDSVSSSTAALDIRMVDLTSDTASNKIVLLQKEALVSLWIDDDD